jgi:general secretion pathway protein B
MSFILDALRKSEHERQRQTGPGLVEVAVAAPKPKTNRWAPAAIALLLVNLVAIGVLLLLKSGDEPAATAEPASAPASEPVPAPVTAAAPAATTSAPSPQATVTQTLPETPPMLNPAPALPVTPAAGNPLEREVQSYAPAMEPEAATAAATPPPGPAAVQPARRGSVVYQSLPEADPVGAYPPPAGNASSAPDNMPRADDMAARGGFPEMKLELHVYSNVPEERIVFINGRRYKAGDTTAEGASVEEITQDGVIMSMGGNRFLLPRD